MKKYEMIITGNFGDLFLRSEHESEQAAREALLAELASLTHIATMHLESNMGAGYVSILEDPEQDYCLGYSISDDGNRGHVKIGWETIQLVVREDLRERWQEYTPEHHRRVDQIFRRAGLEVV